MDSDDPPSSPLATIKADFDAREESGDSEYVDVQSAAVSPSEENDDEFVDAKSDTGRPRDEASPTKRLAEEPAPGEEQQPIKRHRRAFNPAYMNLLNADIEDAANNLLLETRRDGKQKLFASQIGLTVWSSLEKELFFEAVSRLGRDDLPGIAKRVRSKNEVEVRQYLKLFEDVLTERERNPHQIRWEDVLEMVDYPAATELSQPCCDALEEAADELSLRMERYEQKLEKTKWGDELWCVDRDVAKRLTSTHASQEDPRMGFATLFRLNKWHSLSEQIFMNSSDPAANWRGIDEEGPSLRATALEDFHALAVSMTRKLVASSLFVAQSRIKAKQLVKPEIRHIVKLKDVEAAAESIGLASDWERRWATCARRCQLEVYEDPPHEHQDRDTRPSTRKQAHDTEPEVQQEQQHPFSYDEVEQMLLPQRADTTQPEKPKSRIMHLIDFELSEPDPTTSDSDSDIGDPDADYCPREGDSAEDADEDGTEARRQMTEEDIEVREEAKEILMYSARDFPETRRAREALDARIRREREQERYADSVDVKTSHEEEAEMWNLLQRPPPAPLAKPEEVEKPTKSILSLEEMHDSGTRWRDKMVYVSEWEHESKGLSR